MLLLTAHLIRLLIQLLNFDLLRADVPFQLLDLVVEHEFKFLELLDLLLELADLNVFFFDSLDPGLEHLFLSSDVTFDLLLFHHFVLKLILLLLKILRLVRSFKVQCSQFTHEFGQFSFVFQSFVDVLC